MSNQKRVKSASNVRRGRRNRQRGAELQRLLVSKCKELDLDAHNRDRGGAIPTYIMPEKEEVGVVFRGERMQPMISYPLDKFLVMLKIVTDIEKDAVNGGSK